MPQTKTHGDLILYWPTGDPAIRFSPDLPNPIIALAYPGAHILDTCTMQLAPDRLEAIRDWCEERLHQKGSLTP